MSLTDALRIPWNEPFGICGGCALFQLLHYLQSIMDHLWGEANLLSPMTIDCCTDETKKKKNQSGLHSFFGVKCRLTLWTGHHGRGQRVCRRVGSCLSNSTAVVLTCEEVRKCLTERDREEVENVLKRDKPCFGGRMRVCLCVQMFSWVITDCVAIGGFVWVCTASLTTAACHYRPWLLFTGTLWPVEVHLGGCSHLSGPGLGLKLIYRPLIWCLVLIVRGRLLISKLYNVFTLVNQPVRMLWPLLEIIM